MTFDNLGLNESLLAAVQEKGYTTATKIQQEAVPAILTGKDVMAAAQTGTGKTAGFTLPLLQLLGNKPPVKSNSTRALVLTPTRELAAQVEESIKTYGKNEPLRSAVVFGGVNINPQMKALRGGVDILVATPGRLLDLHQQNAIKFDEIEVLILDEADRMLDMGFIHDIRRIIAKLPKRRQNLMFSATFSDEIRTLAKTICHNPIEIDVAPRNSTVEAIAQKIYFIQKERKADLLSVLIGNTTEQVLVFSRTKHGANKLAKRLTSDGISASAIHGNKSQSQRNKALSEFKDDVVQVLVATDIAARGIDIDQLSMVINFDLPNVPEDYVHRIGRTGRAGATGLAVSLVSEDETKQLRDIERLIKRKIERAEEVILPPPGRDPEIDRRAIKPIGAKPVKKKPQGRNSRPANGARTSNPASANGANSSRSASNEGGGNKPANRRWKPSRSRRAKVA